MPDDSTLGKPYARTMGLLARPWSGKRRRVVQGTNSLTPLWAAGEALLPCDDRLYERRSSG